MKASARVWAPIQPRPAGPRLRLQSSAGQQTGEGRQRLRPGGLGVGVAGRPHRRDEHLRLAQLAGPSIDDLDRLPGIVDEQALAGRV
jgi:hypothetical protein